jgi:putative ABC transport system permease protein
VPFVVEPWAVIVAVAASAGIGVLFGWMPARRAARLEPMDAVRSP